MKINVNIPIFGEAYNSMSRSVPIMTTPFSIGMHGSKVTGETLVNTSSLSAGSYTVRLVSNRGNIYDSKTLTIQ